MQPSAIDIARSLRSAGELPCRMLARPLERYHRAIRRQLGQPAAARNLVARCGCPPRHPRPSPGRHSHRKAGCEHNLHNSYPVSSVGTDSDASPVVSMVSSMAKGAEEPSHSVQQAMRLSGGEHDQRGQLSAVTAHYWPASLSAYPLHPGRASFDASKMRLSRGATSPTCINQSI